MIRITGSIRFALIAIVTLLWGCLQDDDTNGKITATGKTSLFGVVTEPESTGTNTGITGMTMDSSGKYSGSSGGGSTTSTGSWGGGSPNGQFEPGVLTAGEWNDLDNWDFWNHLLSNQEYYEDVNKWNLKQIKRYSFVVADKNESLVANAEISLISGGTEVWKTKTDNKGKATLWSDLNLTGLIARVKFADAEEIVEALEYARGINKVYLNTTIENKKIIDIYFAVDATGSMGDEINYLKAELNNVIQRIKQNNPSLEMRFGSVFYRDEGDEYLTRPFNFTSDETSLVSFIAGQSAGWWGRFP
jgi:hypothetical protein